MLLIFWTGSMNLFNKVILWLYKLNSLALESRLLGCEIAGQKRGSAPHRRFRTDSTRLSEHCLGKGRCNTTKGGR